MKVRIKFTKTGPLKFIGHLDLMRYFQKAFRRAEVDIAYSTGFSPHQIISFAAPLGIGITSEGEYMDAEFHTIDDSETMIKRINHVMAEGITITQFLVLDDKERNAMSSVAGADYRLTINPGYYEDIDFISNYQSFLAQETISILKKTKKSESVIDIRPFIYEMDVSEQAIFMKLCTGSTNNLKPETVMEAFCQYLQIPFEKFGFHIHRLETYLQTNPDDISTLQPLGAVGHEAKIGNYQTKE